jgi:hypothetical protein
MLYLSKFLHHLSNYIAFMKLTWFPSFILKEG